MGEFSGATAIVAEMADHGLIPMLAELDVTALPATDGPGALRRLELADADYVFADALLPGLDGAQLLRRARSLRGLGVRPGCVLTGVRGFPAPEDIRALYRPFGMAELVEALRAESPRARPCPGVERERIMRMLVRLGVPDHRGRAYLAEAIWVALNDCRVAHRLSRELYPLLAGRFGVPAKHVERAMRHCIDAAWNTGPVEEQYRLFGNTIDAQRGKPTVGQMIARTADILRLEE